MTMHRSPYIYVGLAGETAPGRPVQSGLYRMAPGDDRWELLSGGLPEAPAIRGIVAHPDDPDTIYVGTQHGPYRSTDHGEHWEKLDVPDHGSPVWSLTFDPRDPDRLYAGYENCEIFRSDDGGEHWDNMSHGQYVNDDTVDMHGVLVGRWRPGTVLAIGRAGLFTSSDQGAHWATARLDPLNPKGQTYCRDIREVPGDPKTIWVAAGAGFQSDLGVLFRSKDGGASFTRVNMGVKPKSTMFTLAFDERQPKRMFCATSGGEVFASDDGGENWTERPLPAGATQVYAMACA